MAYYMDISYNQPNDLLISQAIYDLLQLTHTCPHTPSTPPPPNTPHDYNTSTPARA